MQRATSPQEVYRRVDLDARVAGAQKPELVEICYEQLITALGTAMFAEMQRNNLLKSQSLTRALSAVTALQMGIDLSAPIAGSLTQFYGSARHTILDSVTLFDANAIGVIRKDFADIQAGMRAA